MTDAPDVRRKTLELVDQPVFQQKFERSVNRWRGRAMPGRAQPVQQVIGSGGSIGFQYQAQYFPPQIGEASALRLADLARVIQQSFGPRGKPHMALRGPVSAE